MMKRLIKIFNALIITICLSYLVLSNVKLANAATEVDVIAKTADNEWFQTESGTGEGTWNVSGGKVSVDSFGGNYAMDGATYLTKAGRAIGSYEFETTINIESLNPDQTSPMVGIIPWYIDDDNYLYVSLKFAKYSELNTDDPLYSMATAEEKADGAILEQILVSGRLNGESKYYTAGAQQENTTFSTSEMGVIQTNRHNPTSSSGHKLRVVFEDSSSMATQYVTSIYYNDIYISKTDIYYYNALVENVAVGFLAQDVKATFSNAKLTDDLLKNTNANNARDWKENNGFIYRTLNANDVWTFNSDETVTFNTKEQQDGSVYKLDGVNFAGYNTARGYTNNPVKETSDGVPQNYEIKASFKLDQDLSGRGKVEGGYGLIPWYQDDRNYVDVLLKVTKSATSTKTELILSGWLNGSNAKVGKVTKELEDFNPKDLHEIKVEKISSGFYVYLDGNLLISKNVLGTETNYFYGYNGYNCQYTATKIESKAIYDSFDEIVVKDATNKLFKVSGATKDSWKITTDNISINAKEEASVFTNRSYLIGYSDVTDVNMSLEMTANVSLGARQFSELMLAPYILDEANFARIGLAWHDGKVYARVHASTYIMNEDGTYPDSPTVTRLECEINSVDLTNQITLKAEKVGKRLVLYVNGNMVYGVDINDINQQAKNYGVYISNMNLSISSLQTIGYKKYTRYDIPGGWITSGIKYNEWTITNEGHLIGDATYNDEIISEESDGEKNYAIKELPVAQSVNYQMTVRIKQTGESKTSDRVGVMMWYVDENNFMVYYLDRWRGDSATPRTTIYGKINGQTLPTKYNHGPWLPEGDDIALCECDSSCGCGGSCYGKTKAECQSLCGEGCPCKTTTDMSQVTEWHTITVKKTGNQFVCYVDDNLGARTYTVDAGLPDTTGKKVYAGIYTLNDRVEVSQYNISTVGATPTPQTPCQAGAPFSDEVKAPQIPAYSSTRYEDEIESGKEFPLPVLKTPTVTISESGLASWEEVANAASYIYKINGGQEITTTELSVQLENGQNIVVKAIPSSSKEYMDSEFSTAQTFFENSSDGSLTVIFVNYDGSVLDTQTVTSGGNVTFAGTNPTRSEENGVSYEFIGWDKTLTNITTNLTVNPIFDKLYTVTFKNHDGSVLATIKVKEGSAATYTGETPTKPQEGYVGYEFSGWSEELTNITSVMSVNALFNEIDLTPTYKVTFKNYDGSVLLEVTVKEGEMATYTGETPTKASNEKYSYEFSGWDKSFENITEDTVVTALFTEVSLATKLARPFVVVDSTGKASWSLIEGAVGYAIYINNSQVPTTITDCYYQLNDGETITVVAAGNGLETLDSDPSIAQKYTAPEQPVRKGCGGSIVSSIFGIITLAGVAIITRKKRD